MFVPSRRKFLARGASLGAVLATSSWSLPQSSFANPLGKPVGIQLWSVNDTLKHDPADTLNKLGKIGFAEVEVAGLVGLEARAFRRLLDDAGLRCPSAHLQFDMDNLGRAFDEAHALGATYATASSLIEPVGKAMGAKLEWKSAMSREEAKRTVDIANRIAEAAKRAGLQFTLHNHDREFVDLGNGEVGYDIVWRDTEPKLVQFEIDCGWMIFAGRNPVDYFKKYPGRVPLIHVKDFQPKKNNAGAPMSEEMLGSELGRGTVDYKPILKAAKAGGLKHFFAEQEGPFSRMSQLKAAKVAYDYLHSIT
jgi:sugar phosphate isomerase/epimerase